MAQVFVYKHRYIVFFLYLSIYLYTRTRTHRERVGPTCIQTALSCSTSVLCFIVAKKGFSIFIYSLVI